jgi:hypothetical protein
LGKWLLRLDRISATLYERAVPAWEVFEPARKRLSELIPYLHFEGELTYEESAAEAVSFLRNWNSKHFESWLNAAEAAAAALGSSQIEALLNSDPSPKSAGRFTKKRPAQKKRH